MQGNQPWHNAGEDGAEVQCDSHPVHAGRAESSVRGIDVEYLHEQDEVDIPALIRNITADEERRSGGTGWSGGGTPSGPRKDAHESQASLRRLTEYRNKAGDISSILARDDLTNMKLGAGKVKEARGKEIEYVREMGCMTRSLGIRPFATAGR